MSNQGIIRMLKRIEKQSNSIPNKKVEEKKDSNFISFLALIISFVALYFQFFYYHHDLNAGFIKGGIENDSLRFHIVYHNKGNQDATILKTDILYYSDSNKDKSKKYFGFREKFTKPFILSSGSQKFQEISEKIDFKTFDFKKLETNFKDTLRIQMKFEFLNNNNHLSEKGVTVGWITLDNNKKINYFSLSFENINLQSDTYISRSYRTK